MVGGCAGLSMPALPNSGGSGVNAAGGATVTDACVLLTAAEVQSTVGHTVATTAPFQYQPGQPGCTWSWLSDTGTDNVSLQVVSPGGKADYDSTRSFLTGFPAGIQSLGAAAAREAAPLSSSLAQGVGNLFKTGDVSGLGDAAFMGPGQTLYVVKGDTEIQLQILDVTDPGIMVKTTQLARIILGRLEDPIGRGWSVVVGASGQRWRPVQRSQRQTVGRAGSCGTERLALIPGASSVARPSAAAGIGASA